MHTYHINMKETSEKLPCYYFILLLLVIITSQSALASKKLFQEQSPCKSFVLYYHDILFNGTDLANATSAIIANRTRLGDFNFGMFVVFDNPMTIDDKLLSPPVAKAQGFYFYNKKNEYNAWFAYTLVFNSSECKGTLTLWGQI